ncbi:carbamoyltransferase [Rugamonas sp. CCM 8940]|uniref:carbamoyltransferase family protein n=1 Tax=Rugamonas sp. CCM 8940 TaxID=2765359 RepID=UPI0018F718D9|nr:carbamoyltransferase C-terminal domain-containing protein [Rugamonas sp. CCM 8940]MBJ7308880.1 carbamoyltransferase [Rugamonas sp. CCM 8940]
MKRNYIGLANSFHDSALAIVDDSGEILFAEATERYLQNKRSIGIAPDLYKRAADLVQHYCDPQAELVFASTWSEATPALMQQGLDKVAHARGQYQQAFGAPPPLLRRQLGSQEFFFRAQLGMVNQCGRLLEHDLGQREGWDGVRIVQRSYHHHLTHAATACLSSPYQDALCAVLDGMGETSSFACYRYRDGVLHELDAPSGTAWASLGFFYAMVCEACGFGAMSGEEWKVMGLAPYGRHDPELYGLLRQMLIVDGLRICFPAPTTMTRLRQKLYAMRRRPGQAAIEFADLAYAGQQVFSEVLFAFLGNLHGLGGSDNLVLGGGCGLNSSANGKILANTPFSNLHVFAAPGDDGNAIGAALLAYREDHPGDTAAGFVSPYLGSQMDPEILHNVERFGRLAGLRRCAGDAPQQAARLLAEGKIIGWVQGRAEFGPRALGNRSILADPRSSAVKDTINARVKFREEFRPFAPSILHEHGPAYFEDYQLSPYMERTLKFRPSAVARVPGVVHHDGTGRLQSVRQQWNPRYHALISEFHRLTDIPLVLNTSFNVMGKPIAHSVEDALAVFFTSGLDALFIDDVLIEK